MCGRYSLTHAAAAIAARFGVEEPEDFQPRFNVAPTQMMPVVRRSGNQGKELAMLRWGLIPFWAKEKKIGARMINARSETAAQKPSFRAPFRKRRCLVVTDGFYEWVKKDGEKWPIRITIGDGELGAFAGLWERWTGEDGEEIESYTILTTDASPILTDVHDRMPLWAPEEYWDAWLFDDGAAEDVLVEMVENFPEHRVAFEPVSRELNKVQNEGPELIETIDAQGLPSRPFDELSVAR